MSEKQKTIKSSVTVSGVGLHTGKKVTLRFLPAEPNFGIKFCRIDLQEKPIIHPIVDNVFDTSRGTSIRENGAEARTVEHVLAAIIGLGVDNVLVELDSFETPILDGSSKPYVEAILSAGIVEQNEIKQYIEINQNIYYSDKESQAELIVMPDDHYSLSIMVDYGTKVLNTQNAVLNDISEFKEQIAPCRTFVFLHELEYLLQNNLIKGGDLSNAIVFVNRVVQQEELDRLAALFNRPSVEVKKEGILNNIDLYFENEPARHKLLDVVGDLALLGKPIKGKIIARRPGHRVNVEFAKKIKSIIMDNKNNNLPFDIYAKPLFDINQIKERLPHRAPFLLIDKILEMSDSHVVGLKNVTMNEPFFVGHFPSEPIMPGVLQIEAMAQTGGILVLSTVPDPENYLTLFLKIDKVRFKQKVVPGDTLVFKLDLISPIRRGICHMKGVGFVGSKEVIEAEMMAQIVKKS